MDGKTGLGVSETGSVRSGASPRRTTPSFPVDPAWMSAVRLGDAPYQTTRSIGLRAMKEDSAVPNFTQAGYLVLQQPDEARVSHEYRRRFGNYSGVDRLPPLISPDPSIRQAIGEPPIQDPRLGAVIEKWLDSGFGNTAFIPTYRQALQLLKAFQAFGFRFELVYCQLAWIEGEEDRLSDYANTNEAPPVYSLTYGFDLSWPTCNHSAILQPGVVPSTLSWREKLNRHGLLNSYNETLMLRSEYISIYPYPPFDIYLVHRVGQE